MAVDAILYRFTDNSDIAGGVAALPSTEKIEFNLEATEPDNTGRMTFPAFHMSRDTNIHPNPRRVLDQIQDSLLGIFEITLNGYFIKHNSTLGARNLFNWQVGAAINTEFTAGRFGLQLASFNGLLSLVPSGVTAEGENPSDLPKGYVLHDIEILDVENPRDEVHFTLKLYRNGDITEVPP